MADEQVADAPELVAQARDMGWVPQEEFKGDTAKWVDAATFVEKGQHVLPIVKATANRLREDLTRTNTALNETREALRQSQETIQALEKYHQDDVKQKVEKARADLKSQLVAAKKEGDVEAEVQLTDELSRLNTAEAVAEETPPKVNGTDKKPAPQQKDYSQDPVFIQWKADNPWFGTDPAKSAIAHMATARLRANGDMSVGREFLDKVSAETMKELTRLGVSGGRPQSKVEAGRTGGGASGGSGKTYNDLPADAKAACDGYNNTLVGKGRLHPDIESWRKAYAADYFREV